MNPEHIVGTTARNRSLRPTRKGEDEQADRFEAARSEAVAFALAHLRDPAVSLFGRVKVAGDPADSAPIERKILLRVIDDYGEEWIPRWTGKGPKPKTHKQDTIRNLVRLALFEELYGHVCPECRGQRWKVRPTTTLARFWSPEDRDWVTEERPGWRQKPCKRCKGRGISTWTETDRARILGMARKTYGDTWSARLQKIRGYLLAMDSKIWALHL